MRGKPGLAEMQSMPGCLEPKLGGDARQQRVLVIVGLQQRPQRHTEVAEQAQAQITARGYPQAVAAFAEIL